MWKQHVEGITCRRCGLLILVGECVRAADQHAACPYGATPVIAAAGFPEPEATRRLQRYTTPFRLLVPSSEVERLAAERAPRLSMTEPEAPQGAGSQE